MGVVNRMMNGAVELTWRTLIEMSAGALTATYLYRPRLITPLQGAIFGAGMYISCTSLQWAIRKCLNMGEQEGGSLKKLIAFALTIFGSIGIASSISQAMGCSFALPEMILLHVAIGTVSNTVRLFLDCVGLQAMTYSR